MQTGWIQASYSAAGLKSNLFATQSIIPHKNKHTFKVFNSGRHFKPIFRKVPSIKMVKVCLLPLSWP